MLKLVISSISLIFLMNACTTMDKSANTAEDAFKVAKEYENEERYEEAIRRYGEIRNKFGQSNYALMAELAIADCHFKQEAYIEAQYAYQNFKDLHPKHNQIDYVTFRIGLSYFNQLPTTIDRDLTIAKDAIKVFSEVLTKHANSEFAKEAKEKKEAALKMLAEKEAYIADFYFKREMYESAIGRYENLYHKYNGQGFESLALYRASYSAKKIGDDVKFKKYLSLLESNYPTSAEAELARKELRQ